MAPFPWKGSSCCHFELACISYEPQAWEIEFGLFLLVVVCDHIFYEQVILLICLGHVGAGMGVMLWGWHIAEARWAGRGSLHATGTGAHSPGQVEVMRKGIPIAQCALSRAMGFEPQEGWAEARDFWQMQSVVRVSQTSAQSFEHWPLLPKLPLGLQVVLQQEILDFMSESWTR